MKFSLIIPVAPERNAEILTSIKELDYPKSEFHVIVVKGKNPSENRNKGAEKAKGEIIIFLDDDAVLDKDYLKNAWGFFEKHKEIDIVGGPQLTPKDEKGFAKISGYALSSRFGAWKLSDRYSLKNEKLDVDETALTSANLLCRREVMEKIKFDSKLFPGEDPKFIEDGKKQGFKVAYSPTIVVYHRRRSTIKSLIKQIFNYGKMRPTKEGIIETIKKPFFLAPSLFVLYLLTLIIFSFINFSKILFLPLAVYLILAIFFSIFDSMNNKDLKAIILLPFIYPIIHISYGIGMIWGYLKKIIK